MNTQEGKAQWFANFALVFSDMILALAKYVCVTMNNSSVKQPVNWSSIFHEFERVLTNFRAIGRTVKLVSIRHNAIFVND